MKDANTIARQAIRNTPKTYWEQLCRSRAGRDPSCEGSRFPRLDHEQVARLIDGLVWEPYTHANVKEPAVALIARSVLGGELGVIPLSDVPENAKLVFSDPKNTGKVELVWADAPDRGARVKVDFVVMLVGPDEVPEGENARDIVWTFFPGDPINPSQIATLDRNGLEVTKARAAELGVEWVKVGFTQTEKNLNGSKEALAAVQE